jgi:hypothetical protein
MLFDYAGCGYVYAYENAALNTLGETLRGKEECRNSSGVLELEGLFIG